MHPTVYAEFSPTCANEFPNDNPALHEGARWVCREPLGAPRALLRAPLNEPVGAGPASAASARVPEPAVEPALVGPLELDLARIVLPHRVQDIPPPPEFIFRPLPSSRRAAPAAADVFEPVAVPQRALPLLGYRVVDQHLAASRVDRRWRVDVAPCVAVAGALASPSLALEAARLVREAAPPPPVPAQPAEPGPIEADDDSEAVELESLAHALFPDFPSAPGVAQRDLLEPLVPAGTEPSTLPASEPAAPASESEAPSSKKRQRRRAARVASSASLATAALAANAALTRALGEIESAFSERRVEQPPAERKRRSRKAGKAKTAAKKTAVETPRRRAANAV
ncbi:MAG TPA: hypothetical protein VFS67_04825 [Polyangiaceae bacterium]|nr:hypothetical protein [Polyangiaceae bacterium]